MVDAPDAMVGLYGLELSRLTGLGSGTLYPELSRLEAAGLIEGHWEDGDPAELGRPRRRYYRLTGLGETEARRILSEAIQRLAPTGWTPTPGWLR